jgi:hypothetical protein
MKRSAAAAVALVSLAAPALAHATLPRANSTRIVPGKSVGGVKLDMTRAQALGQWGRPDKCQFNACDWEGPGKPGLNERATVSFHQGKVILIVIQAAKRANGRFKPGKLSDWETKKGVHLGSPKAKVPRAYPDAQPNNGDAVNGFDLFKGSRPNLSYTRFSTPGFGKSANLLRSIEVAWDTCHYSEC